MKPRPLAFLASLCSALVPCGAASFAGPDRPNIIFIMADDLGSADLGCYGSKDLHTPHTDDLAARGIRFTKFYSAAPVCSPSRAAMLTGRWPVRAGVPGNCASQKGGVGALPPEEITLAEIFKKAGYATAHIGKWHLGYTPETLPQAQGFDHSFGHMGGCIDNFSHFFYWSGPNIHDLWRNGTEVFHYGEFFPDLMVREAAQFMEKHRGSPFFIYYALNTPHYPYQGDAKWLDHFKHLPYPRNLYAAFVAAQDQRLGDLFSKVDALGLRERTIIIFQSDNGHSTEERAHRGGGSAAPFRGAKFSLLEGGIRLPAIISWPNSLPQGESRDHLAHACDWLPTLADLAGIDLPETHFDGRSLAPILHTPHLPAPTPAELSTGRLVPAPALTGPSSKATGNSSETRAIPPPQLPRKTASCISSSTSKTTPPNPPTSPKNTPTSPPASASSTKGTSIKHVLLLPHPHSLLSRSPNTLTV